MSNKSIIIWVIVVVIFVVLIYMFSAGNLASNPGQVSTTTAETPSGVILNNLGSTTATTTKPQSRIIEVAAKPFSFTPNKIMVNSGDMLELRITTSGGFAHNFSIDEFGINEPLPNGQTTVIRFTPMKKGTYTFYCAVDSHRERGMVGTLTVN